MCKVKRQMYLLLSLEPEQIKVLWPCPRHTTRGQGQGTESSDPHAPGSSLLSTVRSLNLIPRGGENRAEPGCCQPARGHPLATPPQGACLGELAAHFSHVHGHCQKQCLPLQQMCHFKLCSVTHRIPGVVAGHRLNWQSGLPSG